MWLQQEPGLDHWQDRVEQVETLMVSDVEYEVRNSEYNSVYRFLRLGFCLVCDLAQRCRSHGCGRNYLDYLR